MPLTDTQLAILDLEKCWFKFPARKESLVRESLGLSPAVYYQRLGALINHPDALAADPLTVRRLQRLRDQRARQRSARRVGFRV